MRKNSFLTTAHILKGETTEEMIVLQCVLASLFIGLCAQISVPLPFTPVPLTGQTLGVMLVGGALGRKKGLFAVVCYLVQGAMGCPVFAGGVGGIAPFFGPTGGYLLSYPLVAYLFACLIKNEAKRGFFTWLLAIMIPYIGLAISSLWLIPFVGIGRILALGFYPFALAEALKATFVYHSLTNRR